MLKNDLLRMNQSIFRVIDIADDQILIIDCLKRTMPKWESKDKISSYKPCTEKELYDESGIAHTIIENLSTERLRFVHEHYTMISDILPFVGNKRIRSQMIADKAVAIKASKRTVSNYLCLYLAFQDISVFAPKEKKRQRDLTQDEKNIRWAINKFFYNKNKNSLNTAYTQMLYYKYCDKQGKIMEPYPTFNQFRYFYRKHRSLQTYFISRDGIKSYQRNHRPLLGDGVQEFAPNVGVGMLDSTVCDIYLVDDAGKLIGRPILTACVDAYSSLCCGYALSWEGGTYSLRGLMLNVIADKVEHCLSHGIEIDKSEWDCDSIPAVLVTDMGSEYKSENFEQIAELGVTVVNLPAYRPELKGIVEKFFDLIQGYYKAHLKGKGVVEPDFRERGSHDYRKDACLTMAQFEQILLRCILYYNSKRVIENYPYTEKMIAEQVKPFASSIWNFGKGQDGCNLIEVSSESLVLSLLPRTSGRFARNGLRVNKLRYKCEGYTEMYLRGDSVMVAYNPEDVSCVWLIDGGKYVRFSLIEERFSGKDTASVYRIKSAQKAIASAVDKENIQAQIDLAAHIQTIASSAIRRSNTGIDSIRKTRLREQVKTHRDYAKENAL